MLDVALALLLTRCNRQPLRNPNALVNPARRANW